MRQIITDYYQSEEPKYVRNAINLATVMDTKLVGSTAINTVHAGSSLIYGARK